MFGKRLIIALIDLYRYLISPLFPATCRFYPSCSVYARQAISLYGVWRGGFLTLIRIAKCHPFHPGGFDPVPPPENQV